jgi:hypothetical protein
MEAESYGPFLTACGGRDKFEAATAAPGVKQRAPKEKLPCFFHVFLLRLKYLQIPDSFEMFKV